MPGGGQAGEGQRPFDQPLSVQSGCRGQQVDLMGEASGAKRDSGIGIAQDVDNSLNADGICISLRLSPDSSPFWREPCHLWTISRTSVFAGLVARRSAAAHVAN